MEQKDLYDKIVLAGVKAKDLSNFVQNDLEQMLEDKHIVGRDISEMREESMAEFFEVIEELKALQGETNSFFSKLLVKLGRPKPLDMDAISKKLIAYFKTQQVGNFIGVLKEAGLTEEEALGLCQNDDFFVWKREDEKSKK